MDWAVDDKLTLVAEMELYSDLSTKINKYREFVRKDSHQIT